MMEIDNLTRTRAATLEEAVQGLALTHGYVGYDEMMAATESGELNAEEECEIFQDLGPVVDLALDWLEARTPTPPDTVEETIERMINWLWRFLFGYTKDELEDLQMDAEVQDTLMRVEAAEMARQEREQQTVLTAHDVALEAAVQFKVRALR